MEFDIDYQATDRRKKRPLPYLKLCDSGMSLTRFSSTFIRANAYNSEEKAPNRTTGRLEHHAHTDRSTGKTKFSSIISQHSGMQGQSKRFRKMIETIQVKKVDNSSFNSLENLKQLHIKMSHSQSKLMRKSEHEEELIQKSLVGVRGKIENIKRQFRSKSSYSIFSKELIFLNELSEASKLVTSNSRLLSFTSTSIPLLLDTLSSAMASLSLLKNAAPSAPVGPSRSVSRGGISGGVTSSSGALEDLLQSLDYRLKREKGARDRAERERDAALDLAKKNAEKQKKNERQRDLCSRERGIWREKAMLAYEDERARNDRDQEREKERRRLMKENSEMKRELAFFFQERSIMNVSAREKKFKKDAAVIKHAAKTATSLEVIPFKFNNGDTKHECVSLTSYDLSLLKPLYTILYTDRLKELLEQKEEIRDRTRHTLINYNTLATIRAVFDSRYQLFVEQGLDRWAIMPSDFVEYSYWWVGKFKLCQKTRKVQPLVGPLEDDDFDFQLERVKFFDEIENYAYSKIWDVCLFKEFLEERHTQDELFYFLHIRNIIFGGPQLRFISSTFDVICYVRLDPLIKILRILFVNAMDDALISIIQGLKIRAVDTDGFLQIDSYFVLRLLLEHYKKEKQVKLNKLERCFRINSSQFFEAQKISHGEETLKFIEFSKFMKESTAINDDYSIARAFRLAWSFGNSKVTFNSFLQASNYLGLLLHEITIEGTGCMLKLNHKQNVEEKTQTIIQTEEISRILNKHDSWMIHFIADIHRFGAFSESGGEMSDLFGRLLSNRISVDNRQTISFNGDLFGIVCELWVKLIRYIKVHKAVSLNSSKWENPQNFRRSSKLTKYLSIQFMRFITELDDSVIEKEVIPKWAIRAISKFQRRFREDLKVKCVYLFDLKSKKYV